MAGLYDNAIPTRFLAPHRFLKFQQMPKLTVYKDDTSFIPYRLSLHHPPPPPPSPLSLSSPLHVENPPNRKRPHKGRILFIPLFQSIYFGHSGWFFSRSYGQCWRNQIGDWGGGGDMGKLWVVSQHILSLKFKVEQWLHENIPENL